MTERNVNIDGAVSTITSSLLRDAKGNSLESWKRIYEIYAPLVYCWARNRGLRSEDAKDIGQEVFLAAQRKLDSFQREQPADSFRGWLRAITENKIKDLARQRARRIDEVGGHVGEALAASAVENQPTPLSNRDEVIILFRQVVAAIRNQFSDIDWQIFWAVVVDERRAEDVAEELGVTTNKVYLAKSRILARIRKDFADVSAGVE